MAVARLSLADAGSVAALPSIEPDLNHTQQTLLDTIGVVRNLRDEDDVQCLLFLAGEFALIRPNPFYFSLHTADDATQPCSLILRDTLRVLLDGNYVHWDRSGLLVAQDSLPVALHTGIDRGRLALLAALSPRERRMLAQAALELRDSGVDVRAQMADASFAQRLAQADGDVEVHRLILMRHRLSQ